jgi:hypothetical protein
MAPSLDPALGIARPCPDESAGIDAMGVRALPTVTLTGIAR